MLEPAAIAITGASRGIGAFLVETFLGRGWQVYGCSREPVAPRHDRYRHFVLDVTEERDVVGMFQAIRREPWPLYALVNNAGAASMNHALTTTAKAMERLLRVNALGTMICSREAAKQMARHRRGRIVNLSSVATGLSLAGESAYVASKTAVEGYTRVLSRELGPRGVTVNAVAPNPIRTDLLAGVPQDKLDRLVEQQAVPRYGRFEDVLAVVDFFLSTGSGLVTGQVIRLGGP